MTKKKTTTVTTVINGNQTIQKTVVSGDDPPKGNYFSENFFKTVAAALTGLGLLGIYAYHYSVEYYPVFDIKSAASLVFAAAYTGFILLAIMSVVIFGPWLLVSLFIFDKINGASKKKILKILSPYWFLAYFSFLLIACELGFGAHGWMIGIGSLALGVIMYKYMTSNPWPGSRAAEQGASLLFTYCLQIIPLFLFFSFLSESNFDTTTDAHAMLEFFGLVSLLDILIQTSGAYVVIAWLSRMLNPRHKTFSVLSIGVVVVFMTVLGNQSDFLGAQIAAITKFGNFYATEMTLSKDGCKAVNADGDTVCTGNEETGFKVCGVYVVSRIGTESYLRIFEDKSTSPPPSKPLKMRLWFTKPAFIPTKEVLGIKIYDPDGDRKKADQQFIQKLSACRKKTQQATATVIHLGGKEFFELNKAELGATGKIMLAELADKLLARKDVMWTANVYGYSDQLGKFEYNKKLSNDRALVVANFLKSRLPDAVDRILPKGEGSAKPKKSDAHCPLSMAAQARIDCFGENRRTEIEIVDKTPAK